MQADVYLATARYVRLTVTGLSAGNWASFWEMRVLGKAVALPATPSNLVATAGYKLVSLNWSSAADATSYAIKRATTSGAETMGTINYNGNLGTVDYTLTPTADRKALHAERCWYKEPTSSKGGGTSCSTRTCSHHWG